MSRRHLEIEVVMFLFFRFLPILILFLSTQVDLHASSVSLIPIADTEIIENGTANPAKLRVGGNNKTPVQRHRSLIKFGIAGNLPINSAITNVTLTVTVINTIPPGAINSTYDLRVVLVPWSEMDATWINRLNNAEWTTPGGAIGADFTNHISQTTAINTQLGAKTFVSNSNLIADVQIWLQNSNANFGWVIISEGEATQATVRDLASREDGAATAPTLIIQYTVPPAKPTLGILLQTNNNFRFSFPAETNHIYIAQYIGNLSQTNWAILTNFSAATIPTNRVVSDPLTSSNRFYRVQAQ